MNSKFEELKDYLAEIHDLYTAASVLSWDQQTYMPIAGAESRAMQMATLIKHAHELFASDKTGQLLDNAKAEISDKDYDSLEVSLVRVTRRKYNRLIKIPTKLVVELTKATSLGDIAWRKARETSDFSIFQPHLEKILDLTIQKAEALGYEDRIYDALLYEFEPEMKTSQVEKLFNELKTGLIPIVKAISNKLDIIDDSIFDQEFDEDKQWNFGIEVIKNLGFDFKRGRQDHSAHPFTTGFSTDDVRITTHIYKDQFKSALFSSIHEAGHAMYDQGLDKKFSRTILRNGASLGVHESQSRLWENIIGRNKDFWIFWLPHLKKYFPTQLEGVNVNTFYKAINKVEPSLIRIEADEITYNLHIFLRFEIEKLMLEHKIKVRDLPELWNSKMKEYLGIFPENDAKGVLQDIHWSHGMIGYFPTYSLGNMLSVLFYNHAVKDIPAIPDEIKEGNFEPLLNWMREKIHKEGAKYTPDELVKRVTGEPIQTEPFLTYIKKKYSDIYDL